MGNCHNPQSSAQIDEAVPGLEQTVRIGLIADIQYADREDGSDYAGNEQRHFRHALDVLRAAVECWNIQGVSKIVQLGDAIDGCNAKADASITALRSVLSVLNRSTASERIDLVGNHELYNMKRADLKTCGLHLIGPNGLFYHALHFGAHWEAIVLDPYELSLLGLPESDANFKKAEKLMKLHNPQVIDNSGSGDWYKNLPPDKYRYVPFNGGMSVEQLAWLEQALRASQAEGRHVLVFSHVPLYEPATKPKTLVWNCEQALAVLHRHKDAVVAVLAGHDHDGGYAVDAEGLHHVTMHSALTAAPGTDCFAVLECHADGSAHFRCHGRACVESGTRGQGRAYKEIVLAKGAQNEASGLALQGGSSL